MSEPRTLGDGLDRIQARIAALRERPAAPQAEDAPKETPRPKQAAPKQAVAPAETPPTKRVHPNQRGYVKATNEIAQMRGQIAPDRPPLSYYSPELIQCTLPHSDPKTRDWARKNGNFALVISSGVDGNLQPFGVPYGSFPRLVLAHIITRVVATRERRIDLASHFSSFLKEIGYTSNHRGNGVKSQRLHDQLSRLLNAHISFQYREGDETVGRMRVHQMSVAPDFDLWWNYKAPEQESLFSSWVEISQEFYDAILRSPVPLRTDVLKALKKSPLAIDVYMWVSYRLFGMRASGQQELHVSFSALQAQFGTGIAEENYRQFRQELKIAFSKVAVLWHEGTDDPPKKSLLQYEFIDTGLQLYHSPLLVGRGDRMTDKEAAADLFTRREFSTATRAKARVIADKHNIDYITQQYFEWVEKKGIVPATPDAHYLKFVRSHVKRNP